MRLFRAVRFAQIEHLEARTMQLAKAGKGGLSVETERKPDALSPQTVVSAKTMDAAMAMISHCIVVEEIVELRVA